MLCVVIVVREELRLTKHWLTVSPSDCCRTSVEPHLTIKTNFPLIVIS